MLGFKGIIREKGRRNKTEYVKMIVYEESRLNAFFPCEK